MRIAIVAPIEESVPPKKYGGIEWIAYYVADGIAKKGHQVDLYASGDSNKESDYYLIPTVEKGIRTIHNIGDNAKMREATKLLTFSKLVDQINLNKYDIIHNHAGWRFLLFGRHIEAPIVTTHHMALNQRDENLVFRDYKNFPYVSISNNQRRDFPSLNFVANVYNGTDIAKFPFVENPDFTENDYMAFLARLSDDKGPYEAAQTALKTKHKIRLAVKIDLADQDFYEEKFKPLVDNDMVTLLHELDQEKRLTHLQNARLLIAPIKWEEPFGLMFTESMACGTPVVAFSRGSAPEIIVDGKTGFLVNESEELKRGDFIIKKTGIDGLCEAVERIYSMPKDEYVQMRKNARQRVEEHFTVEKMVDGYEKVYKEILSGRY